MSFAPGDTVVLREVIEGRVRSARPLRVVADEAARFVGYLVPRSTVAWPRLADGTSQSQTPDQGWQLPLEPWHGPGCLFVVPAGAGHAVVLFFDRDRGTPLGWKVDFLRPLRRHAAGFDTLDLAFDLLAEVDLRSWHAKDLDDLAQIDRLGVLTDADRARLGTERTRVEGWLTAGAAGAAGGGAIGTFGEGWTDWRPDPGWAPLQLPPGWADLAGSRSDDDVVALSGPGIRNASGCRVLNERGEVLLDLDLAGGAAWLGHAPASLVDALARQLTLGWHPGGDHPALHRLGRVLLAGAPAGWSWCWADRPHGADLDPPLMNGMTADLASYCGALGTRTGCLGPALTAGLGRFVVVGPADALPATGTNHPTDLLAALAALETLRMATPEAVGAAGERAERLRRRHGLGGSGLQLVGPAGWSAPGVLVPADGRGRLALCATDADVDELDLRLARARRS